MSGKKIVLWLVLIDFAALTAYAVMQHGYLGFFELVVANWATRLMFVDLVIALSLIAVWMLRDARERGASFWPYLALTLFFGAAGPLLYLIRREASALRELVPNQATSFRDSPSPSARAAGTSSR
jgi:hypothetical protein